MTSKSTTDNRARNLMKYGLRACSPEVCAELEGWQENGKPCDEFIREIYTDRIMKAVQWYTDDLVFAYNSPKAKGCSYSKLEEEIFESLVELPEEVLRILAAVMMAKTGAN